MKCINCNKEIPDTSVVCPYCNGKVDPVVTATPVFNVEEQANTPVITSGVTTVENNSPMVSVPVNEEVVPVDVTLPVTPTEPQLPTDQNNLMVETAAQPVVTPDMINNVGVNNTSVEPVAQELTSAPVSQVEYTEPTPSDVKPSADKKSGISKKIIIIIIVVLLLAGIGFGVFYYLTVYKSSSKRLNVFANKLFEAPLINSLTQVKNNESVELASGEYEFGLDLDFDSQKITGTLFGKYGIDTKNKISDITLNLKNVNLSGIELISEKNPLSIEVAAAEDKLYVLLQNFYNKYISAPVKGIGKIYDGIEQNDFDYKYLIDSLKKAFVDSFSNLDATQTVGSETIDGSSFKANIVTVKFDKNNKVKLINSLVDKIKNNSKLVSQFAKISGSTENDIKSMLDNAKNSEITEDGPTLKILSSNFGGEFLGAILSKDADNQKMSLELTVKDGTYKIVMSEDGAKVMEFSISEEITKEAATTTNDNKINLTFFSEGTAYKAAITLKNVKNVNPKVEKIDTKNSVSLESISEEDMNSIMNKVFEFGMLGQLIKEKLGPIMQSPSIYSPTPYVTSTYDTTPYNSIY